MNWMKKLSQSIREEEWLLEMKKKNCSKKEILSKKMKITKVDEFVNNFSKSCTIQTGLNQTQVTTTQTWLVQAEHRVKPKLAQIHP